MPLVSVIVPVYNTISYLDRCIQAILSQSFQDFELILVNDGSDDGSGDVCERIANERKGISPPVTVLHQENRGVSAARNTGIRNAKGEYIVFVDSDDLPHRDYLEQMVKASRENPDSGHIWGGMQVVYEAHKENPELKLLKDSCDSVVYLDRKNVMKLYREWAVQGPYCKLYRTETIRNKNLQFVISLDLGEDLLFNLEYLNTTDNTEIVFINRPLYNYIQYDGQRPLSSRYRQNLFDINHRLDTELFTLLKTWNIPDEDWNIFYRSVYYHGIEAIHNTFHPDNHQMFCMKIHRNHLIMKDQLFQNSLGYMSFTNSPLYGYFLKTCDSLGIFLYETAGKLKQRVKFRKDV